MTKTIEFDDIRVGDKIRATRISTPRENSEDKCTNIYEFTVTRAGRSVVESDVYYFSKSNISKEGHRTTFELLERAPKVFTVGDAIAWADLRLLKNGTVLVNTSESHETPRIVDSVREYLVLNSIDRFPFSYYDDNMFSDFVIAYIPEG